MGLGVGSGVPPATGEGRGVSDGIGVAQAASPAAVAVAPNWSSLRRLIGAGCACIGPLSAIGSPVLVLRVGKFRFGHARLHGMSFRRGRGRPPHPDLLTPAEWQVLDWVRHGVGRAEVARRRGTSVDAVKYHLANISDKLGVRGRELRHWPGVPSTSLMSQRRTDSAMTSSTTPRLGAIGQVSLSIRDVNRAERFYGQILGLPHVFTFGDLAFFDAAGTRLYLHRKKEAEWRPGSILYFLVDDIHATQDEMSGRGVRFTGAPHVIYTDDATGTEEWMTFFEDGEGNTLALMSRVLPET